VGRSLCVSRSLVVWGAPLCGAVLCGSVPCGSLPLPCSSFPRRHLLAGCLPLVRSLPRYSHPCQAPATIDLRGNGTVVCFGDGTNPTVLRNSGVERPRAIFITYGEHGRCLSATLRHRTAFPDTSIYVRIYIYIYIYIYICIYIYIYIYMCVYIYIYIYI